jgi:hypothetical protein
MYEPLIAQAEQQNGLPPGLLAEVIRNESGFNPHAHNKKSGAHGIAQFMPATAKQYGVDTNDPKSSILGAGRYLGDLHKQFGGDSIKALAGYNWGPGNVEKKGLKAAPKETKSYIDRIIGALNPINSAQANEDQWVDVPQETAASAQDEWVDVPNEQPHPGALSQAPDAQPGVMSQKDPLFEGNNWPNVIRKANVAARGVVEGVAGLPGAAINTANVIPNAMGANIAPINTEQYGSKLADVLGAAKPTANENILYPVSKGVGSFVVPAGAAANSNHWKNTRRQCHPSIHCWNGSRKNSQRNRKRLRRRP